MMRKLAELLLVGCVLEMPAVAQRGGGGFHGGMGGFHSAAVSFQGTALPSALAFPVTGLTTARDGVILTTDTATILTRLTRILTITGYAISRENAGSDENYKDKED